MHGCIAKSCTKLEPNMLKIVPIIPSSTFQKITHHSYFILISLPIIPKLFLCIDVSGTYVLTSGETRT